MEFVASEGVAARLLLLGVAFDLLYSAAMDGTGGYCPLWGYCDEDISEKTVLLGVVLRLAGLKLVPPGFTSCVVFWISADAALP